MRLGPSVRRRVRVLLTAHHLVENRVDDSIWEHTDHRWSQRLVELLSMFHNPSFPSVDLTRGVMAYRLACRMNCITMQTFRAGRSASCWSTVTDEVSFPTGTGTSMISLVLAGSVCRCVRVHVRVASVLASIPELLVLLVPATSTSTSTGTCHHQTHVTGKSHTSVTLSKIGYSRSVQGSGYLASLIRHPH